MKHEYHLKDPGPEPEPTQVHTVTLREVKPGVFHMKVDGKSVILLDTTHKNGGILQRVPWSLEEIADLGLNSFVRLGIHPPESEAFVRLPARRDSGLRE